MQEPGHGTKFWIGNALLALSLALLFFMGALWEYLGGWAMGLWMALAGLGMYLVMSDPGPSPTHLD